MIKLPIKYTDFDDNQVTEDHYFHLSKAELIKLESGTGETLSVRLEKAGKSGDGGQIMAVMAEVIELAYGQRVDGSGSQFYKDPDITRRFMGSLAFDQLLEDLLTNVVDAVTFVNGLMPSGLAELAAKVGQPKAEDVSLPEPGHPPVEESGLAHPYGDGGTWLPWAFREATDSEMMKMNHAQLLEIYARKSSGWKPPVAV